MNVSWLTSRSNDRWKTRSLLPRTSRWKPFPGQPSLESALMRPFTRRALAVVLDGCALDILQVEGGIQEAAIAAEALGLIERGVGFPHQCGLVDRRAVSGGDARADGDVSAAGGRVRNAQRPNCQPNALGDLQGGFFRCIRQHDGEFLATIARGQAG